MKKLLVALVALLIAASPAFAEEAKELNVFSWSEYIPQEVVNGFTKETGIKVVLSTYESNEAMYAKLKLLGAKGYDLVVPSGYFVEVMAQDNLLAKLDKSKIKGLDNLDPASLNQPFDHPLYVGHGGAAREQEGRGRLHHQELEGSRPA